MAIDYGALEGFAVEQGAYKAKVIDAADIVIDERVRAKCQIPLCEAYGKCIVCPPNTLSVHEFADLAAKYQKALLVQVKVEKEDMPTGDTKSMACIIQDALNNWNSQDIIRTEKKLHELVNKIESKAMSMGAYFALGLKASHCRLCDECVGVGAPEGCSFPYLARPSVEGVGVDVVATAKRAGLNFELFANDHIVYTGLVLLD